MTNKIDTSPARLRGRGGMQHRISLNERNL
jgi:hypothetical protein